MGYTDSDWVGSVTDRQSTSGCCFSLGLEVIEWHSRKQTSLVLSTTKVEYIATFSASSEVVWLRKMLYGLVYLEMDATCIYCDN